MNNKKYSIAILSALVVLIAFSFIYFLFIKPKTLDQNSSRHLSSNTSSEKISNEESRFDSSNSESILLSTTEESANSKSQEDENFNITNKVGLTIGFVPLVEQDKLIDSLDPLTKLLSSSIKKDVKAFTATNYVGVIEALGSGQVDFALLPPLAYVLAHQESNAELLLSAVNKEGKSSYRSQFVVRNDDKINSIQDMKDKIIGFVDPSSSSGYVYPAAFLKKNGYDLDSDIESVFCGGHDAAIEQLLQGDVDVACTYDDARKKMLKDYPELLEQTKVVAYSDDIPYIALVASSKLDKETQDIIKSTFMKNFNDGEGKQILSDLFNLYGFKESSDSDYDGIREISKLMDIKVE